MIWCIILCITLLNTSASSFNEISSIDSKFDTLNMFYKDFKKLNDVKSQNKNTKQRKITVLKMRHCFMISLLICIKKNIIRFLKANKKTGG